MALAPQLPDSAHRPRPGRGSRAASWAPWLLTCLAFPIAGLPAIALGGVDGPVPALAGGAAAGLIIGLAQLLALRRQHPLMTTAWVPWTGASLALGLAVGAAAVDYRTGAQDLAVQGLLCGAAVGAAQGALLGGRLGPRAGRCWAAASLVLWPVGWLVTTAAGVDVEQHYAVFGASGALVHAALGAAVLHRLSPRRR